MADDNVLGSIMNQLSVLASQVAQLQANSANAQPAAPTQPHHDQQPTGQSSVSPQPTGQSSSSSQPQAPPPYPVAMDNDEDWYTDEEADIEESGRGSSLIGSGFVRSDASPGDFGGFAPPPKACGQDLADRFNYGQSRMQAGDWAEAEKAWGCGFGGAAVRPFVWPATLRAPRGDQSLYGVDWRLCRAFNLLNTVDWSTEVKNRETLSLLTLVAVLLGDLKRYITRTRLSRSSSLLAKAYDGHRENEASILSADMMRFVEGAQTLSKQKFSWPSGRGGRGGRGRGGNRGNNNNGGDSNNPSGGGSNNNNNNNNKGGGNSGGGGGGGGSSNNRSNNNKKRGKGKGKRGGGGGNNTNNNQK